MIAALKLLPGKSVADAADRPTVPLQTPLDDKVTFSVRVRLSTCRNPPNETFEIVSV